MHNKIDQGLFGGIVVLGSCDRPPQGYRFPWEVLRPVFLDIERLERMPMFADRHIPEKRALEDDTVIALAPQVLLSLDSPRTDAPVALPEPARNPAPIGCADEPEPEDVLLRRRSELRLVREERLAGRRTREADDEPVPSSTHLGFAQVALMKVLQTAKYPEREAWLEQFKSIETRTDAELFMVEAKLQIRHDIDFKRPRRTAHPERRLTGRDR